MTNNRNKKPVVKKESGETQEHKLDMAGLLQFFDTLKSKSTADLARIPADKENYERKAKRMTRTQIQNAECLIKAFGVEVSDED